MEKEFEKIRYLNSIDKNVVDKLRDDSFYLEEEGTLYLKKYGKIVYTFDKSKEEIIVEDKYKSLIPYINQYGNLTPYINDKCEHLIPYVNKYEIIDDNGRKKYILKKYKFRVNDIKRRDSI